MTDDEVEIIRLPNNLKSKVGPAKRIDPTRLQEAERMIADMQPTYEDWSREDTSVLSALYDKIRTDSDGRSTHLMKLFHLTHNMKGQGSTFKYPLATQIAGSLSEFVEPLSDVEDKDLEVIKAHIDALTIVFAHKMSGDGGQIGEKLVSELTVAVNKVREDKKA